MVTECTLNTVELPRGGLPRNIVVRITDRPDMTLAVYRGHKALNQTNKQYSGDAFVGFNNSKSTRG